MTTRRDFFRRLAAGFSGVFAVSLAKRASAGKVAVGLDKVPQLKEVGGYVNLKLKGKAVLLVRESEKSVRATEGLCTHQQCPIDYNPKSKKIECHCHASSFDLAGKVLGGPAPKPLIVYPAQIDGNRVIIDLK